MDIGTNAKRVIFISLLVRLNGRKGVYMGFSVDEFPFSSNYDSDLREVITTMRSVLEHVESYDSTIQELQTALSNISGLYDRVSTIEGAIADLQTIRNNISALQRNLASLQVKHNQDVNEIKAIITIQVSNLQQQIDNLELHAKRVDRDLIRLRAYMDSRFNVLSAVVEKNNSDIRIWISSMQNKLKEDIEVIRSEVDSIDTKAINPWRTLEGKMSVAENLGHIYNELADEILTASEYVKLGLDAESYSILDISARGYAEFGKELTHFYWKYAPGSGYRQDTNNVLTDGITFVEMTMTADEYRLLDLNADSYGDLDLSADDYYRYGEGTLHSWINSKQKKLVAGKNITIADDENGDPVISANGIQPIGLTVVNGVADFHHVEYDFIVDLWVDGIECVFSKIPRELVV